MKYNLLKEGSVKDIYSSKDEDQLVFSFSDRYSIFDWGEMPDHIHGKGDCLKTMAKFFFTHLSSPDSWKDFRSDCDLVNELKKNGVKTHFLGDGPSELINSIAVKKYNVPDVSLEGGYNYDFYNSSPINSIVPLEVIFRFEVVEGSSILKRSSEKYLSSINQSVIPLVGSSYADPIIEVSTKLESMDTYLGFEKAKEISGLDDYEFKRLVKLSKLLAMNLREYFNNYDIKLIDGKFEFAFGEVKNGVRELVLIDSIGPDELRLVNKDGKRLSKDFLRSFYRESEWYKELSKAKELSNSKGVKDWKSFIPDKYSCPPELPRHVLDEVSLIYKNLELITGDRA